MPAAKKPAAKKPAAKKPIARKPVAKKATAKTADTSAAHTFPKSIGAPATRAFLQAGYTAPEQLAGVPEKTLLALHGVGPKAVRLLADFIHATPAKKPAAKKGAPAKGAHNPAQVDAHMEGLEHPFKAEMQTVRTILTGAGLQERVKWNAPSFFQGGQDFAAFHPRETAFLHLIVLFPNGLVDAAPGLLGGTWDGRREIRFTSKKDVQAKRASLEALVKGWLALVPQS